jgi:hypothetical protein
VALQCLEIGDTIIRVADLIFNYYNYAGYSLVWHRPASCADEFLPVGALESILLSKNDALPF